MWDGDDFLVPKEGGLFALRFEPRNVTMLRMKSKYALFHLATLLLTVPLLGARADSPVGFEVFATFDYPGFGQTFAFGINDAGDVAGSVYDGAGHAYGFIRHPDGHLSELISDPRSDDFTVLVGINNLRQKCGAYAGGPEPGNGFLLGHKTFILANFPAHYIPIF